MATDAERIMKDYFAALNSHDVEKIASFFTDDCIFEDVCGGAVYRGQEALKAQARAVLTAVPDLHLKIESLFAAGDWLGCEWIETGTKAGRRFSVRGASIVELEGNKVRRESMYCHFDGATWLDS